LPFAAHDSLWCMLLNLEINNIVTLIQTNDAKEYFNC
jgi:hypothetical protein